MHWLFVITFYIRIDFVFYSDQIIFIYVKIIRMNGKLCLLKLLNQELCLLKIYLK